MNLILVALLTLTHSDGPPQIQQPLPMPVLRDISVVAAGDKIISGFYYGAVFHGVLASTECYLDGKRTPYFEIPDDTTELVEIAFDPRKRVVRRMVYVTREEK